MVTPLDPNYYIVLIYNVLNKIILTTIDLKNK